MQTPKGRSGSSGIPKRKLPAMARTARQLKTPGSDSDSVSSLNSLNKTPKDRSPKVNERKSARSPLSEKKRPGRVTELESQLAQLEEDLKKVKDQLNSSESFKRRAQQEAEDAKKQLSAMSAKLQESQQQLLELSASDDVRVQELCKISQDRDRAWQSELEAVQNQHSIDSAALASALNEIHKLKGQLEMVSQYEAVQTKHAESAHAELQSLRMELAETLSLVENLRTELGDCRESEAEALELVKKLQEQLETANAAVEVLRSDGIKTMEAYSSISTELEQSKARVKSLEELVSKLQAELVSCSSKSSANPTGNSELPQESKGNEETNHLKAELNSLKVEVNQLKSALEASETRYHEEYVQSTLQIRSAYEQAEHTKSESCRREAELDEELKKAIAHIEELRGNLMDKETELQSISEENEGLNLKIGEHQPSQGEPELPRELKRLEADIAELRANLLDKETQLQNVNEHNEMLKMEIKKRDKDQNTVNEETVAVTEMARASEHDALIRLGHLTEEADKSSRRAERVTEQLDAAQAANTELEAEMRMLKVQSDQWRKAAEAAAAMLLTGNNGKLVEKTGSLDGNHNTIGASFDSPYSEDMDDDSPKKKNGNMLKKIGVLWKKGQK
ncbi:interactor of constitutive active ROPs 2 chloroplastic isoform X1 [Tripterygium wilfordii]|uniref:Interactor of constitutive active ROPs 2 chloroplastic isoform X1 n=1 Tax=Tripterygium wilfordii TaxID=458696 RepID=A0A7J7DW55_TRIWF|nr:interactor of constitutive active ROPs 2, chloroplastic-like [Tripterygium wilfordii]XP_038689046.1 interactor of constitutive active ROPs 2, chloroplastic-like [Tripterygium wilfordii]XP_038689055.1 interactor of constitutive active ROPs 2, chloroplastic-like [Tripterygium wilfordii]KAF5750384.1 interactor of constitutive active ROPs 2 chloroplastic isoform X1 [Tripterygium wilfordii]